MQWTFLCDFSTIATTILLAAFLRLLTSADVTLTWCNNFFGYTFVENPKYLFFTFKYVSGLERLTFNKLTTETHLSSTSGFTNSCSSTRCIVSKTFPRNGSLFVWYLVRYGWSKLAIQLKNESFATIKLSSTAFSTAK